MPLLVFSREHYPSRSVPNNLMWSSLAADLNDDCKTPNSNCWSLATLSGAEFFLAPQRAQRNAENAMKF